MAVWIILASAFLHAFWNARLKRQPDMDVAGFVTLTTLGIICATSFLLILLALESVDAGYVLTLRNASILFALLLAWQMGEKLMPRHWLGAGCIAAGAVLLGLAEYPAS